MKSQIKKLEARATSAEELLSQKSDLIRDQEQIEVFYSCMKLLQTVCPNAVANLNSGNLELEFSGLSLKENISPVQKLQESLRDLSHLDLDKLRDELEKKFENRAAVSSNGLITVSNFKEGDYALFLPTKHQPGYNAMPQAFTTLQDTIYLDRSCYKSFGLSENEPLRTWLIGRCTSSLLLEAVGTNCHYPAGKIKQSFYIVTAEATEYVSTEPRRRTSSRNLVTPVKN